MAAVRASEHLNDAAATGRSPSAGTTNIFIAVDGAYTGHLCLADTIKDGAAAQADEKRALLLREYRGQPG